MYSHLKTALQGTDCCANTLSKYDFGDVLLPAVFVGADCPIDAETPMLKIVGEVSSRELASVDESTRNERIIRVFLQLQAVFGKAASLHTRNTFISELFFALSSLEVYGTDFRVLLITPKAPVVGTRDDSEFHIECIDVEMLVLYKQGEA